MRNRSYTLALGTLLATSALATPALAQDTLPNERQQLDENGVNPATGQQFNYMTELSIGPADAGGLRLLRSRGHGISESSMAYGITGNPGTTLNVVAGLRRITFNKTGGVYVPSDGGGATLIQNSSTQYTLTLEDGTVVVYKTQGTNDTYVARGWDITFPNGQKLTFAYRSVEYCSSTIDPCPGYSYATRLQSISSSLGYQFHYNYARNTDPVIPSQAQGWLRVTSVQAINTTIDPCDPTAVTCTITQSWPTVAYDTTGGVTDPAGNTWRFTEGTTQFKIRRPSSATDNIITNNDTSQRTTSVVRDGMTWTYNWSLAGNLMTMTRTDPLSHVMTVISNTTVGLPTSITNELGKVTTHQYDANGRLTKTTFPEGNYVQLSYDSRGNVTQVKRVAKTPGSPPDIITSSTYPASCSNPKSCNNPTTTTDARGNVTDYTYSTNGDVATLTSPAPTAGAVRPQLRYAYSGVTTPGGSVTKLQSVSQCQTLTSCTGAADEAKTSYSWSNQLALTGVTRANGTGTLSAVTTITNDGVGNPATIDGPLAGTADTTTFRYDLMRRQVGVISADPDGGGTLKRRAVKTVFTPDGGVQTVQRGTVNGTTDPDWAAMVVLETQAISYDSAAWPVTFTIAGSDGITQALTQQSYDGEGRPDCIATRMNPAIYGSLPASACTLGTAGSFGPDRITKTVYDNASQVTQQQVAVGTADAATEATFTYSNNGKPQTLKDAENNLTTYVYDGHDRLSQTQYPNTPKGSGTSNPNDFEQLSYDAASNVTSRRLRDAQTIAFTYDNLNRPTLKNLPGSEPDVTYAYDNLGRLISASQTGNSLSFSYDALSRNLTQVGPQGTVSSQWDLAGRRTRLTYPGSGLYVDYDYLVTGETTKIRENGATSGIGVLAAYGYDDLGRRTALTFGNGAAQAYGYDPVSRLTSLTNNLTGTTNDLSQALGYNPAGQIISNVRTGDVYAWTAHYNENRNYTANGLNQYTASGAIVPTYDSKGNLTSAGTTTYAYSSENMLLSATGGTSASLAYDPALRLYQVTAGASTSHFAYDGLDLIAEYDAGNNLLRRHVHGPGADEPLVWYEGSGTTDRRFLGSDERGSIVSVSDGSGNMLAINSYDEYGIPGSANAGRFQYTGQAWLPELGLQYSKARIYSPTLGRFLQTDPIDVEGGVNLYAYVGDDPVNFVDPLGLDSDDLVIVMGPRAAPQPVFFGGNIMSDLLGSPTVRGVIDCGGRGECSFNPDITVRGKRSKSGIPPVAAANPSQGVCAIQPSTAAQVAAWANTVGEFADGAAVASATLGVVSAPTGAGGAFFGGAALLAGGVGRVAVGVSIVANLIDGNAQGAGAQAMTFVGGAAGGFAVRNALGNSIKASRAFGDLSAGQRRAVNVTGEGTAAATGYALGTIGC